MDELLIRKASADDAKSLVTEFLPLLGSQTDNLSFGKEGLSVSIEDEARYLEQSNDEKNIYLVAVLNGKIIGTCQANQMRRRFKHRSEIAIGLLKEYWGRGYASKMLEQLIKLAKEKGTEILQLEVLSDNTRAIRLYTRHGFSIVGHYRNFSFANGSYHDAEIMELMLCQS